MFTLQQRITPAVQSHIEQSMAFFNDMSKTMLNSFNDIAALNTQLAKSAFEDAMEAGRNIATSRQPTEALSAGAALAQPAAERLREYRQSLAQVAADAQTKLTRVAEQHVPEVSKTAQGVAQELVRTAQEQTEEAQRRQQEALERATRQSNEVSENAERRAASSGDQGRQDNRDNMRSDAEQAVASGAQAMASGAQAATDTASAAATAAAAAARRQQPQPGGGARKT